MMLYGNQRLTPFKLTYEILKATCDKVHDQVVSNNWKIQEARCYMEVHCLNKKAQNNILKHALNVRRYEQAYNQRNDSEIKKKIYDEIEEEKIIVQRHLLHGNIQQNGAGEQN